MTGAMFLVGCADLDNIHERTITVNRGTADYYNELILLNIARASKGEPLTFVSLANFTGHNTLQGTAGLPTITVGPHTPATPTPERNYGFGPNTVSCTASNDWNASVLDDPASYAGLLAPTNPATIGFFINQGFSREILLFLFVDRMVVTDLSTHVTEEYRNLPFNTHTEYSVLDG